MYDMHHDSEMFRVCLCLFICICIEKSGKKTGIVVTVFFVGISNLLNDFVLKYNPDFFLSWF